MPVPKGDANIVTKTTTGEVIRILHRPDAAEVRSKLQALLDKDIRSIGIAFVHSYLWGEHEEMVAKMARELGFNVSVSSQLQPMVSVGLCGLC